MKGEPYFSNVTLGGLKFDLKQEVLQVCEELNAMPSLATILN